jgi:pimeloyl-ACP methyl ester carboxylesterase
VPFRPLTLTRLMLRSRRAPLTRTPADAGLAYEDVAFRASDGVGLKGWFVAAGARGPAIAFVHGWMWNRLGNVAGQTPVPDKDVDFLPAVAALHEAGFHVLLFDLRGHGESDDAPGPQTYGPVEARDFVGAVEYLRTRADVDGERIGAIGTSAGGNIVLYGAPDAQPLKAVLAIQPTRLTAFNTNFARTELGPLGPALVKPVDLLYAALGAPRPSRQDPAIPARRLNGTVVQYVQGTGDQWGELEVVETIAAATPHTAGPVIRYPSTERYSGYQYISERSDEVVDFFGRYL